MARRYRPRIDAYPENLEYQDNGCDLHSACLTCPFEVCRYDPAAGPLRAEEKTRRVAELAAAGHTVAQIGEAVGLGRRSVYRHLRVARRREGG